MITASIEIMTKLCFHYRDADIDHLNRIDVKYAHDELPCVKAHTGTKQRKITERVKVSFKMSVYEVLFIYCI